MKLAIDKLLSQAIVAQQEGRLQEAEHLYRNILHIQPKHPDANHNLGVIGVTLNQIALALPFFRIALEENPYQEQYWISYIKALINNNQTQNAKNLILQSKKFGISEKKIEDIYNQLNKLYSETDSIKAIDKKQCKINHKKNTPSKPEINNLFNLYQKRQYANAENIARKLTLQYPNHSFAWKVLGAIYKHNGQKEDLLFANKKAVELSSNDAEAHNNLGNAYEEFGRLDEAVRCYKKAITLNPKFAEAYTNLANIYKIIGKLEEAVSNYNKAINHNRNYTDAYFNLAITLTSLKKLKDAETCYKKIIKIKPDFAQAYNNLGIVIQEQGQLEEALNFYKKAVTLKPDYAIAYNNYGFVLNALGKLDEAKTSYEKAINLQPNYAEAYNNYGITLKGLGKLDEAKASYQKAIDLKENFADAYNNLAITHHETEEFINAEAIYLKALQLIPNDPEYNYNLGITLRSLSKYSSAEASIRNAIAIRPSFAEAHNNLGVILQELGRSEDALASYRKATALKPYYFEAYSNLLFTINYIQSRSIDEALQEAKQFGLIVSNRSIPKFTAWNFNSKASKIRVGFISGDLKNHPVGYFTEGLIKNFNKDLFEIISFPTIIKSDDLTIRIKPYFKEWIPIYGKTDLEAATIIYSQNIQILIDLSGHSAKNRLPVFSYKPAPVQITWLGYFATTGLPEMDYILGDPYVTPQSEVSHFSEKIRQLPETYLCFSPPNEQVFISPLPALENGFITFGCFNNLSKMGNVVVKNWASILKAVPNSKLFLKTKQLGDAKVVAEVFSRFAVYDITPDRLVIEGYSPRGDLLVAYNRVDIALDPFPYPGGTTSVEALWMGVPVLTLKGDRFLSHVGESIASNVGNTDWIAINQNDYVAKAVEFSNNLQYLSTMRNRLRHTVLQSPLFDSQHFANNFSKVLQEIWDHYMQNKKNL